MAYSANMGLGIRPLLPSDFGCTPPEGFEVWIPAGYDIVLNLVNSYPDHDARPGDQIRVNRAGEVVGLFRWRQGCCDRSPVRAKSGNPKRSSL